METHGGVEIKHNALLTLALDGGEQSASHFGHFTPWKEPSEPTGHEAWASEPVWMW